MHRERKSYLNRFILLFRNFKAVLTHFVLGKLEMVKLLREKGAVWESSDNNGSTPLHLAVDGGNVDLIRWMIKDGCPVSRILTPFSTQSRRFLKV